jgi:hypothetical protein
MLSFGMPMIDGKRAERDSSTNYENRLEKARKQRVLLLKKSADSENISSMQVFKYPPTSSEIRNTIENNVLVFALSADLV